MRFLQDQAAIETSEVAVIIAVVVLVAYGAYQLLGQKHRPGRAGYRRQDINLKGEGYPCRLPSPFNVITELEVHDEILESKTERLKPWKLRSLSRSPSWSCWRRSTWGWWSMGSKQSRRLPGRGRAWAAWRSSAAPVTPSAQPAAPLMATRSSKQAERCHPFSRRGGRQHPERAGIGHDPQLPGQPGSRVAR